MEIISVNQKRKQNKIKTFKFVYFVFYFFFNFLFFMRFPAIQNLSNEFSTKMVVFTNFLNVKCSPVGIRPMVAINGTVSVCVRVSA